MSRGKPTPGLSGGGQNSSQSLAQRGTGQGLKTHSRLGADLLRSVGCCAL